MHEIEFQPDRMKGLEVTSILKPQMAFSENGWIPTGLFIIEHMSQRDYSKRTYVATNQKSEISLVGTKIKTNFPSNLIYFFDWLTRRLVENFVSLR